MSEEIYLIAKAKRDSEYRPSLFNKLPGEVTNDVYRRKGGKAMLRREGKTVANSIAGSGLGAAGGAGVGAVAGRLGGKSKKAARVGAVYGGAMGSHMGSMAGVTRASNQNIRSGDLKITGRGKNRGKKVKRLNMWSRPDWE